MIMINPAETAAGRLYRENSTHVMTNFTSSLKARLKLHFKITMTYRIILN
jgi:hypothetical protein